MQGLRGSRTRSWGNRRLSAWASERRRRRVPRWRLPGEPTFDVLAILAAGVLVAIGLANLAAVGGVGTAVRQGGIAAAGFALLLASRRVRVRVLGVLAVLSYTVAVVMLAAVPLLGNRTKGATRWLDAGAFTFQPSELAKLGLLLLVAALLASARPAWQRFAGSLVVAAVPIVLTVLQPDLSTTALLVVVVVALMVIGRVPARFLLPVAAAAAVAAPLAVGLLRPYQVQRLGSFLAGSSQAAGGAGWAASQARIAVASGGWFGRAGHPLTDVLERYLPERSSDLAPASLVEQFGWVAGLAVLVAALVLVWRLATAARGARTSHGALVAGGLAVLIGAEVVVSVGGNLGLLPLAGVPFPLVSNGGTAMVVHLAAIGTVLGVRRDGARRALWAAPGRLRPRLVQSSAMVLTGVLVTFAVAGGQVQAQQRPSLVAAGQEQMVRCLRVAAPRGEITARDGTVLAQDSAATDTGSAAVGVVPALVTPAELELVADVTGRPLDQLRAAVAAAPRTTLDLEVGTAPAGRAGVLRGSPDVIVTDEARRSYPTGELLAPVLGFVGVATAEQTARDPSLAPGTVVGRLGLEATYDAVLRGVDGRRCWYVTPAGVPVAPGPQLPAVPGADLRTALDLPLQRRLTDSLRVSLAGQPDPRAVGAAVAMDPRDGQVLAMASLPSYDDNIYGPPVDASALAALDARPGSPGLNHVTQVAVPPGSTFKLVVGAADMVTGTIPPMQVVPTGASFTLGGHTFANWRPMGPMNLPQAIGWSNDVYFYQLAARMGPGPIIQTARALGVGEPTGIDLPGEAAGYLGSPDTGEPWYGGTTVILGIGQGPLQVTPLQNARWTAAITTGLLVTPHLGLAVVTPGGATTAVPVSPARPLPFAATLGPVRDGMRAAVRSGTAGWLAPLPVDSGAKTGTAQDGSLRAGSYDNWTTVAAPLDAPTVVVTSLVQGPGQGANSAGRIVVDGLSGYLAAPPP
ncbi:penicillin-binding protein transpeptidase [Pseudonocardia dioxanivorans CB1190]|uniref:beta-lactamase n=1 Tax=Pseudonocardia dioxanivorans (strain ATCC 55486 / DSM 44775 / JCM 13855 / CB1190) TaxID=675635 RepID=F4CJY9_PSEUX|nr:FtsW/RodA/SpoVE family cell cycle protein [Pseudonocardia dioxanivorans]AEA27014.1 penicillin-binding protein transpeptidase [Pseudonocardia dioxanivorans CB1190]